MFFIGCLNGLSGKTIGLTFGCALFLSFSLCSGIDLFATPPEQRSQLSFLTQQTAEAARLYSMNRKKNAAELIDQIVPELVVLLQNGDPGLHEMARPLFERLQRATELLKKDRIRVGELPSWESMTSAVESAESASNSISFSSQIAPLLSEHCKGCHIGGRQASGGLRMDSYSQLMRGGSAGEAIISGRPEQSLLIGKLTGRASGQRMPAGGRSPLSEAEVSLFSEWIRQGASFDGSSTEASLDKVSALKQQSLATPEELNKQRLQLAQERFRQAFPNELPQVLDCDELVLIGNIPVDRLEKWQAPLQQAVESAKKFCGVSQSERLVRGRLTVFILSSRYDYSEFGRMVQRRELPRQWPGHWIQDSLLPSLVLIDDRNSEIPIDSLASQLILGGYLGNLPGMQFWFAEGMARNSISASYRRQDSRIRKWQQALPEALQRAGSAQPIVEGKLDEETLSLLGLAISETIASRGNRPKLQTLLKLLRTEVDFSDAMRQTFGEPQSFVTTWMGK
jgi:PAS domain-containing protein